MAASSADHPHHIPSWDGKYDSLEEFEIRVENFVLGTEERRRNECGPRLYNAQKGYAWELQLGFDRDRHLIPRNDVFDDVTHIFGLLGDAVRQIACVYIIKRLYNRNSAFKCHGRAQKSNGRSDARILRHDDSPNAQLLGNTRRM